jgi:hypothetical protein
MMPKKEVQDIMLIEGLLEILFKMSGGGDAVFCLPGEKVCFDPPSGFLNDNVTEKVL